jgi:hypothetical protein
MISGLFCLYFRLRSLDPVTLHLLHLILLRWHGATSCSGRSDVPHWQQEANKALLPMTAAWESLAKAELEGAAFMAELIRYVLAVLSARRPFRESF